MDHSASDLGNGAEGGRHHGQTNGIKSRSCSVSFAQMENILQATLLGKKWRILFIQHTFF